MAGAGYKLFNTGDVLTAAQVNTYLMEQTVMVFNDAAARTTALSGVLSEGMISYLKDTNATEVYNGSAWVGITGDGDITGVTAGTGISGGGTSGTVTITNDMATTITAAGDIVVGTGNATYDNLPIGTTGQVLTADTTVSPYKVKWAAPAASGDTFAAGKNKIINGDFRINQRNSTSVTTDESYVFDRFQLRRASGGTVTFSSQTFTLGSAPVAGYEGTNYARLVTASQSATGDYGAISQKIEGVRTFANQTITVSAWVKGGSGGEKFNFTLEQVFGSGGGASASVVTRGASQTVTNGWVRYSTTFTVPSISGKTIGTPNYLAIWIFTSGGSSISTYTDIGNQNATVEFWGLQAEAGSTATDFQTATGTLAGELAACQRYYQLVVSGSAKSIVNGAYYNATSWYGVYATKVSMRTAPTISQVTGTNYYRLYSGNATDDFDSISSLSETSESQVRFDVTSGVSGTQGNGGWIISNNASSFIALQAEL